MEADGKKKIVSEIEQRSEGERKRWRATHLENEKGRKRKEEDG